MEIRNSNEDRVMSQSQYYKSRFDRIRESRWFPLAVVTVSVLGFSAIVSYAYNQGAQAGLKESAAPIVRAEADAFKIKPTDAGGMEIPFQDTLVFDQLDPAAPKFDEGAESLLPPPEEPMDRPEPTIVQEVATQSVENTKTTTEELAKSIGEKIAEAEAVVKAEKQAALEQAQDVKVTIGEGFTEEKVTTSSTPSTPNTETIKQATAKATSNTKDLIQTSSAQALSDIAPSATTPSGPSSNAAPKLTSGTYHVQLGSFRDRAAAETAWKKFQKTYAPSLDGVASNIERADLGDKGIYYRVQGTNLSKTSADTVCSSINAVKSGACLVKK